MKLSIVTINYNNLDGLKKTVNSVVAQKFKEFEYIVIDGGSTDGSREFIEANSEHIDYWVSEPDKGVYNAMNKGINQSKGGYLLFLNSGDWLVNEQVLELVFKHDYPEDIIYGNVIKVSEDSSVEEQYKGFARSNLNLLDIYFKTIPHQSVFIAKRLFDEFGLYKEEYRILSDWAFFLKVIGLENTSVKYINLDISYYDTTGISSSNGALWKQERDDIVSKVLPKEYSDEFKQIEAYKWKANTYDKMVAYKPIWYIVSFLNKLFGRPFW